MTFTDELWAANADIYAAILAHPFITGLTDGTLPEAAFAHYIVQDAIYLRDYARSLAVVATRDFPRGTLVQIDRVARTEESQGGS